MASTTKMADGGMTIYRSCEPVVDTRYGRESGQSPSEAIIQAVAAAAGVEPTELPPLFDFVDPDALDTLFQDHTGAADAEKLLSFRIKTWNVFVRADGRVLVCDGTQCTDPQPVFQTG